MVDDILDDNIIVLNDEDATDDVDDSKIDRSMADISLMIAYAELKLHIMAARQCIQDNDYLLYLYNKGHILTYLEEVKECKAKVIEAMFNAK